MRKTIRHLLLLVIVSCSVTGCVTQKQLTFLHDADSSKNDSVNATYHPRNEAIIRSGDALTIFVSALDKEAVTPYNLPTVVYSTPGSNAVQTTPMLQHYLVDDSGDIELPVLGKVHVAGMQRNEVAAVIQQKLVSQIVNPLVQVDLVDARVTVLGEVARPGRIGMSKGRLTILEALASAGDMTSYGRRDNVLVTREVNGKIEMGRVNLRSTDLFSSPYYFLQQNDVVYVSPNKVRAISSTNAGLWLSMVSTVASAATVIVTVINTSQKK